MKIIKVVPGDAGGYRCEVTAKDKCDSSTFEISVECEWKQTLACWHSFRFPNELLFWSDPALMCVLCNFSGFSCTAGGARGYFVCLQESVSASGVVFQFVTVVCVSVCLSVWLKVHKYTVQDVFKPVFLKSELRYQCLENLVLCHEQTIYLILLRLYFVVLCVGG